MTETSLEEFLEWGYTRAVTPVVRRLFADSETPMGLYRKLSRGPGSFLLESADQGGKWSRYSFLGVSIHGVLAQDGSRSVWRDHGMSGADAFGSVVPENPLEALEVLHRWWLSDPLPDLPPFAGGLVGHIGWEAVRLVEHLPSPPPASHEVPAMHLALVQDFVAFDHHSSEVVLVALTHTLDAVGESDYRDALARLDLMHEALTQPTSSTLHQKTEPVEEAPQPSLDEAQFFDMVARANSTLTMETSFKWCCRNNSNFTWTLVPWRCTGYCARSTPAPTCTSSSAKTLGVTPTTWWVPLLRRS